MDIAIYIYNTGLVHLQNDAWQKNTGRVNNEERKYGRSVNSDVFNHHTGLIHQGPAW